MKTPQTPPIPGTLPIRVQEIVILNTPMVMFIDLEADESDVEELSENEWSTPHTTPSHTCRSSSIFAAPKSLHPDVPLHMRLQSQHP